MFEAIPELDDDEFFIDEFKIKFISNNHIKGSVAIFIENKGCNYYDK